jgi:hypothetical protein
VKPQVMRRLVVPVTLRLYRLHLTLPGGVWLDDSHLFEFFAGKVRWGIPTPATTAATRRSTPARLCDIVQETGAKTIHCLFNIP